jgi:hypothetical protein
MRGKSRAKSTSASTESHIGAIAERLAQPPQAVAAFVIGQVGHEDGDQALGVGREIAPFEMALRLASAPLAERQQAAESRIGGPVG